MNIINQLWEFIEEEKDKTKIASKVYNWLNLDNLNAIILDNNIFWFEKMCSYTTMPNYIYSYLIKWGEKQGYTYLYKK